jgi:hypothetical protein
MTAVTAPRPAGVPATSSGRHGRLFLFAALAAAAFLGALAARQELETPGETVRDELIAAAVDLASPAPTASEASLRAIRRHFPSRDPTLDTTLWPEVAVTLHHLDRVTCAEARMTAGRIDGIVVVELEPDRTAVDCGDDNAMTWRLLP